MTPHFLSNFFNWKWQKTQKCLFFQCFGSWSRGKVILVKNETGFDSYLSSGDSDFHFKWSWKILILILFQNSGYSVIASSIRFNLISEFRNRQLKPDTLHDFNARCFKKVTIKAYRLHVHVYIVHHPSIPCMLLWQSYGVFLRLPCNHPERYKVHQN